MSKDSKVWVIDPESLRRRHSQSGAVMGSEKTVSPEVSTPAQPPDPRPDSKSNVGVKKQRSSNPLILLAYVLGPFAMLVIRQGRRSRFWTSVAAGSGILSAVMIWQWSAILSRFEDRVFMIPLCILVMCLAIGAGLTAWARAALLIGRRKDILRKNLPSWIRRPRSIGSLGLFVPGLGLLIAGYPKRAASALWIAGIILPSTLILSQSTRLLRWHQSAGITTFSSYALEYAFLALGLVVFIGALSWIIQALDGARLAGRYSAKQGRTRNDRISVVLLTAMVAFFLSFKPAFVARELDRHSVSMHQEGYRIVPLCFSLAATHLDPSEPKYVMHTSEFYDDLGKHHAARIMRDELLMKWRSSVEALREHGLLEPDNTASLSSANTLLPDIAPTQKKEPFSSWERIIALYGPSESNE